MAFLRFALENRRFLAFGFLLTFASSFGQTFFISLFSAEIRAEFALSHGDFGLVYSLATLVSGICLVWLGRQIDRLDLRLYSSLACAGLVAACFLMAAATSVVLLWLAIFALRLTGQGLLSHTAVTSMARYFDTQRGKAVSIASLGMPLGETVFPLAAVGLTVLLGWRGAWTLVGALLVASLPPLVLWLLKGHDRRHALLLERTASPTTKGDTAPAQWSRREVLRDPRFYLLLPAVLAPSYIITGLLFHQVHLAASKGWSLAWLASCFVGYAGASVSASLLSGPIIDRIGALRLLPYFLLPMGAALFVLAVFDQPVMALAYMVLAGATIGAGVPIGGAIWAELYGVRHLGAIRALTWALMVFASALSPVSMGWLIDAGASMEAIALFCLVYIAIAVALVVFAARRQPGRALTARACPVPRQPANRRGRQRR